MLPTFSNQGMLHTLNCKHGKKIKELGRRTPQRIIVLNFISCFNNARNNLIDTNTINPVLSIPLSSLQSNWESDQESFFCFFPPTRCLINLCSWRLEAKVIKLSQTKKKNPHGAIYWVLLHVSIARCVSYWAHAVTDNDTPINIHTRCCIV